MVGYYCLLLLGLKKEKKSDYIFHKFKPVHKLIYLNYSLTFNVVYKKDKSWLVVWLFGKLIKYGV